MFARSIAGRTAAVRSCYRMPLRAKVTNPAFAGRAMMSTADAPQSSEPPEKIRELPGDVPEDVLFSTLFGLRTMELNAPKKHNSLTGSMIRKIVPRMQEWAKSDMANVVVIKGAGDVAFCAGGDVKSLAQDNTEGEEGMQRSIDYFELEYKLNHLIATYSKPYVAFMDGITMGGGVGLSAHAPFRIATEKTVFAMPETTIGFFPDVGASYFLPRMAGATGTYLALTSERLKGENVYYAGIATHYIHSTTLPALEHRLAELRFRDYETQNYRLDVIDRAIEEFVTGLPNKQPPVLTGPVRTAIDYCFGADSVEELVKRLQNSREEGVDEAWYTNTLESLKKRSPTSLYVTHRQMKLGRSWSIAETFKREHQIAAKFMRHPDFTEGVHALLIRKDGKPKWTAPSELEAVKPTDDLATPFFEIEQGMQMKLLTDGDYHTYPHVRFGLPRESDIKEFVREGGNSLKKVVAHFESQKRGKEGVKTAVQEVLSRCAYENEQGIAVLRTAKEQEGEVK